MIGDSRLILISYPSGGFGNFIYYMLSEFSSNTYKINNKDFDFSATGDSHAVKKYIPTWFKDPDNFILPIIDSDKKLLLLCDNGINNDSYDKIKNKIIFDKIIRLNIDHQVRPVIYLTCIEKALKSNVETENLDHIKKNWSDSHEDYAIRENFSLFYHNWFFKWQPIYNNNIINLSIKNLIDDPISILTNLIKEIGGQLILHRPFEYYCNKWRRTNMKYFQIYYNWQTIEQALDNSMNISLQHITDLHEQGYINYCIEQKFNVIIPVYDYKDWFQSTDTIKEMIKCLK